MKTIIISLIGAVAFMLLAPLPAMAGSKCTLSTQECLDKMVEFYSKRGWVGIEYVPNEETRHMEIRVVVPGSPAEKAGLKVGDIITGVNGIEYSEENEAKLNKVYKNWTPGTTIEYMVKRDGYGLTITLVLGELPRHVLAQWIGEHMLEHSTVKLPEKKDE